MKAYYNEFDPKAAAWLRALIKEGLIANGDVDERNIVEVKAGDIAGYSQCHWFAGIGGWSYALRLALVADSEPVWTASLPCQPFSVAGKGLGKDDERHLLPHFIELVRQSKPKRLFGEQVAAAISHGWLDDLQAEMEGEGYTVGAAVLGAHSVGSFHQRQRLYWVAHAGCARLSKQHGEWAESTRFAATNGFNSCGMGKSDSDGREPWSKTPEAARYGSSFDSAGWSNPDWIECRDGKLRPIKPGLEPLANGVSGGMVHGVDPDNTGLARRTRLRGYGNAIVPQTAAEFINSFYECL